MGLRHKAPIVSFVLRLAMWRCQRFLKQLQIDRSLNEGSNAIYDIKSTMCEHSGFPYGLSLCLMSNDRDCSFFVKVNDLRL